MPGDYTRLTFDPLKDRAMLLEQQGRVHLDADFNELAAMFERRVRVETRDLVGPAVYPAIEPDSFKLKGAPAGPWTIGRGRVYVDGLLAENHGVAPMGYEPVWGEPQGTKDTPVGQQPYVGTPQSPAIGDSTDELVYLDVWQRERTCVEDPSVLEPALGVDTATRIQTAWQVRSLQLDGDGMNCGSDWGSFGPWQDLIRPSDARLSSAAVAPPEPADPCAVAPVGGYRGVENRLYRVEMHDGGGPGAATLKWSRDNGAVASRITALTGAATQPIVTVERLGRDEVLRFHAGEWVELLDDVLELDGPPGLMGQVLETDQTQSTVTLTAPLTGTLDLTRNPRLRRWDQKAGVNTEGVIPVTTSPQTIDLEDGIQVTIRIDGAGARAHVADWWVFAARAATASIEELDAAPPRGIRHHFARLAVIHSGKVQDCRIPWPPVCDCEGDDCGCTRCVTPASHQDDNGPLTIQAAIDAVIPTGGRVCLAPGRYRLERPLRIAGAHGLTLAGEGLSTLIEAPQELGILVQDSIEVSLERITLIAERMPTDDDAGFTAPGIAIALVNTLDSRVERCFIAEGITPATTGIGLAGIALRTRLVENVILAGTAIGDIVFGDKVDPAGAAHVPTSSLPPAHGIQDLEQMSAAGEAVLGRPTRYLLTADLAIEDNILLGVLFGVRFGDTALGSPVAVHSVLAIHAAGTRVARNIVLGGLSAGISLLGLSVEASATAAAGLETQAFATLASSALLRLARTDVRENLIVVGGDGIRATLEELSVENNTLHGRGVGSHTTNVGVHLGGSAALRAASAARIAANTIADQPATGVYVFNAVGSIEVEGNRIERTGLGGIGIRGRLEASDARVAGNVLEGVALRERPGDDAQLWGIRIDAAATVAVSGNLLRDFATDRGPAVRWGVAVHAADVIDIDGNQLLDLGPSDDYAGEVDGIIVVGTTMVDVRGNTVRIPSFGERALDMALLVGALKGAGAIGGFTPQTIGPKAFAASAIAHIVLAAGLAAKGDAEPVPAGLAQVAVHGNTLHGGGAVPTAFVSGSCNATIAENRVRCVAVRRTGPVLFAGIEGAAIVSANHVEGPEAEPPVVVLGVGSSTTNAHATVLGNITHGWIELNGGALGSPWAPLNVNA